MSISDRRVSKLRALSSARSATLSFEKLESRQMLSADSALIVGNVLTDTQMDGNAANDTAVVGASVSLYRDGGNGVLGGDDTLSSTTTTNASGGYRFENLGAGTYFVKVTPPSGASVSASQTVQKVTITADEADGVTGLTVDGFTTFQYVEATPPLPSSDPSALVDSSVLGGERDLYVELTEGISPITSVGLASGGGLLWLSSDPTVTGNATIVWDGVDGDGQTVNPTGLGGIDLTQYNGNTMTGISLTSGADHPDAQITLRVYSDANNWSEFTTIVPESVGGAATGEAVFLFDNPVATSGTGADFTNVGALVLNFNGVSALDGQVSVIELVGMATKQADFTFSGFDLALTKDVDRAVASPNETLTYTVTITNSGVSNAYNSVFTDTLPGGVTYVSGSTSIGTSVIYSGGEVTSNLGTLAPGATVTITLLATVDSSAVGTLLNTGTVSASKEVDLSNNTDTAVTTVVPKIDLTVTKTDSQDPVEPGATFSYTITAINNGPSDATGVTLTDTLPEEVTYLGASQAASVSGDTVVFAIGNLASGGSKSVTVQVKVDEGFVGQLLNTVVVSGNETETNPNNNTATEPTLVKIDPSSISGTVYVDRNQNGKQDSGESPIANVKVTLTGKDITGAAVSLTTITDSNGNYSFDNLLPGTYRVVETHPDPFQGRLRNRSAPAGATSGASPGPFVVPQSLTQAEVKDLILGIELGSGVDAQDYDFGELAIPFSKNQLIKLI